MLKYEITIYTNTNISQSMHFLTQLWKVLGIIKLSFFWLFIFELFEWEKILQLSVIDPKLY